MPISRITNRVVWLLRKTETDRPVVFSVLGNITSTVLGLVTALLIVTVFSPQLQGYYYTFGSLSSLQYLVELGFGQAVIQFVSHEWVHLSLDTQQRIVGAPDSLSRLVSLGRLAFRWYAGAALAVWIVLCPLGYLFFYRSAQGQIDWMWPWLIFCVGLGLNLFLTPAFVLLQGCNQVAQYWYYWFVQQIVYGSAMWVGILLGAGLWIWPLAISCMVVWSIIFLRRYRRFLMSFLITPSGHRVLWRSQIWPIQWRIALSWFSSGFTNQLFTPILFRAFGPVLAGQMGMTNSLTNILVAISSNWVVTKGPRFGSLIAQRRFQELDNLFLRSFLVVLFVSFLGAAVGLGAVLVLNLAHLPLSLRILPPLPIAFFLACAVFSSVLISLSIYLRAFKQEPLVGIFLMGSLAVAILAILFGSRYGALGIGVSYFAVLLGFELPISVIIFWHRRASWHAGSLA